MPEVATLASPSGYAHLMTAEGRASDLGRRLTVDFSAWLDQSHVPPERFYREALVVLDANVLLDLYRITPNARNQVLDAFNYIEARLWVPYQAAIEFSRNRKRVVEGRMSAFKRTSRLLRTATANAVDVIEDAIEELQSLREETGATREWNPGEAGLGREDLLARLDGVMDSAIEEFRTLEAEHDLRPKDMQHIDPLLSKVDELLVGKIGPAYSSIKLRSLVEEAHSFRFPNKIPPGYLDVKKESQLHAAGDYILWRQAMDMAARITNEERLILLITNDSKADWWEFDSKGRPKGPHPELVQEMRDTAGADLLLATLKEFIGGTKQYLSSKVSDETLEELEEVSESVGSLLPDILRDPNVAPNLLDLDHAIFERLIRLLLIRMGYHVEDANSEDRNAGFDFLITSPKRPNEAMIVQTKRYRRPVSIQAMFELVGVLRRGDYGGAIFFATSEFTLGAKKMAHAEDIEIVGGADLVELFAEYGINVTIDLSPGDDSFGNSQ